MAKPILTILLKATFCDAFNFVEALVQPLGFQLINPRSGKLTHWTDGGEQIAIVRDAIGQGASTGAIKNIQFWKTDMDDLFVSWTGLSSGWRFSFHLNGIDAELKVTLATVLSKAILVDLKDLYAEESGFSIEFD